MVTVKKNFLCKVLFEIILSGVDVKYDGKKREKYVWYAHKYMMASVAISLMI